MELEIIGALKIKDGLFVGDEFAAQDLEFVVSNKVTRIVNCSARQVPNHWEPIGVKYLSYSWLDTEDQVIFDLKDKTFNEIFSFIDQGVDSGDSVLVHSVRGQSRCLAVVSAFMMRKYRWSLTKSLEFVNFRRPDMDLRQTFVQQLNQLEGRLQKQGFGPKSENWTQVGDDYQDAGEELVLRNTYLNAQMGAVVDYSNLDKRISPKKNKLNWSDNNTNDTTMLVDNENHCAKNPVSDGFAICKSCVKGCGNENRYPLLGTQLRETKPLQNLANTNGMVEHGSETTLDELQKVADEVHLLVQKQSQNVKPIRISSVKRKESPGSKAQGQKEKSRGSSIGTGDSKTKKEPKRNQYLLKTDVPKLGSFKFNFKTGSVKKRRPQTASGAGKKAPVFELYRSEVRPRTATKGVVKKVRGIRF